MASMFGKWLSQQRQEDKKKNQLSRNMKVKHKMKTSIKNVSLNVQNWMRLLGYREIYEESGLLEIIRISITSDFWF